MTYQEAIKNVVHLRALGQTDIYLHEDPKPWHLADKVEPGSHRLEIATSVIFSGEDSATGLRFRWIFDIESLGANGKGHYEINCNACREVLKSLPEEARKRFAEYLADCAVKVEAKAQEWVGIANRQLRTAATLSQLAKKGAQS